MKSFVGIFGVLALITTILLICSRLSFESRISGSGSESIDSLAPGSGAQDVDELWGLQETEMRRSLLGKRAPSSSSSSSLSFRSPSNGTDLSQPISLVKCNNQTRCVQPFLELQVSLEEL